MLYISLSTGRSATRFWRKCIYANAVMLISRLRSFSPAPGGPGAYVFLFNNAKASVTLVRSAASTSRCRMRSAASTGGVFRATSWARNLCSRGPRGLKFFMHSHPLMGGRPPKFQKKNSTKKFFFRLISPTYYPAHNSCSTCTRGLKFVMRNDPPHVGPTTTFSFKKLTKIVHLFNFLKKKTIPWRVPTSSPHNFCSNGPRVLQFVMCSHTRHAGPTTAFLFLNLTKIVRFFNFFKNVFKINSY